jgi:hypothetical protein
MIYATATLAILAALFTIGLVIYTVWKYGWGKNGDTEVMK